MIKGTKQEYECIANRSTQLTRDVEYFLEVNHPRKLNKNNFGAYVVGHYTSEDWEFLRIKEIILERDGEYCLVNYMQGKGIMAQACVYVAEPIMVPFIKEEA